MVTEIETFLVPGASRRDETRRDASERSGMQRARDEEDSINICARSGGEKEKDGE